MVGAIVVRDGVIAKGYGTLRRARAAIAKAVGHNALPCTKTVRGEADGDPGVLPGLRGGGPAVFR